MSKEERVGIRETTTGTKIVKGVGGWIVKWL